MSTPSAATYDITLTHLSPDLKKAAIEFSAVQRPALSLKELGALLRAAEALAPSVVYPAKPEIRIEAPSGKFVVQIKEGRLHYISWGSLNSRGGNPTVNQILGMISGEIGEGDVGLDDTPAPQVARKSTHVKRALIGAVLGAFIAGANALTFVQAKRPPGNFLPPYRVLEAAPAERFLTSVTGNYESGSEPGDRRLQITRDGNVVWIKFGPARAVQERKEFTAQAVEAAGATALLTSKQGLIKVKDASTISLYGDTYIRSLR